MAHYSKALAPRSPVFFLLPCFSPSSIKTLEASNSSQPTHPLAADPLKPAHGPDMDVDHYTILGLPSGGQGAKLTEKEISKAYRAKALELLPDKRPNDPNAHENFQLVKSSYEILKDEKTRKLFDDLLRVKREQQQRQSMRDSKRQKMMADLEARERAAFDSDPAAKNLGEEERMVRKLNEDIARIRAMHSKKGSPTTFAPNEATKGVGKENVGSSGSKIRLNNLVGADYQAREDSILKKLLKAAAKQKG